MLLPTFKYPPPVRDLRLKGVVIMANQPMAKVRVGSVGVALWENEDDKKGVWHSVMLQRHYKSEGS